MKTLLFVLSEAVAVAREWTKLQRYE